MGLSLLRLIDCQIPLACMPNATLKISALVERMKVCVILGQICCRLQKNYCPDAAQVLLLRLDDLKISPADVFVSITRQFFQHDHKHNHIEHGH